VASVRYYYEARHQPWTPVHTRMLVVEAPTAIGSFPCELLIPPSKWAERYYNLKRWTSMTAGGILRRVKSRTRFYSTSAHSIGHSAKVRVFF